MKRDRPGGLFLSCYILGGHCPPKVHLHCITMLFFILGGFTAGKRCRMHLELLQAMVHVGVGRLWIPTMMAFSLLNLRLRVQGTWCDGRDGRWHDLDGHEDLIFTVDSCNDSLDAIYHVHARCGKRCAVWSTRAPPSSGPGPPPGPPPLSGAGQPQAELGCSARRGLRSRH